MNTTIALPTRALHTMITACILLICTGVFSIVHGFGNYCGDGIVSEGEECDDNNSENWDGCTHNCKIELDKCGDGIVDEDMGETCDDGNNRDGDGCTSECGIDVDTDPAYDYYLGFLDVAAAVTPPCMAEGDVWAANPIIETDYVRNIKAVNLLKSTCIIQGYTKNGQASYQGTAPLGVAEAIKMLTKLQALRQGRTFDEHGTYYGILPYQDLDPLARYTPYVVEAYDLGMLDNFRTHMLKPLTAIKPVALQQMFTNMGHRQDFLGQMGFQDWISREHFAAIAYELYQPTLDQYRFLNGNNPVVLAWIHGKLAELPASEHEAFLMRVQEGFAEFDSDFMMSEYIIDSQAIADFAALVLAE